MSESSPQSCYELVQSIRAVNESVDGILASSETLAAEQIDELDQKIQHRGVLLDELRRLSMKVFPQENTGSESAVQKFWNSFGSELLVDDKNRLALLKSKVDFAATQIRSSMNSKSLLQYQRG